MFFIIGRGMKVLIYTLSLVAFSGVCNVEERIGNVHGRRSGLNGVTLRQIK